MDKKINKIEKDYMSGMKYSKIEKKHNITRNRLEWLIKKYSWKRESNRSEALKGNQNAIGNKGGPGAELGNKRALKTGEYENIFNGVFSDDEKQVIENKDVNKREELLFELQLFKVRESRILARIENLRKKDKELVISHISKRQLNGTSTLKENIDEIETNTETETKNDALQRLEDALTRVQEAKRRCLDSIHKVDNDIAKLELEERKLKQDNDNKNEIEDLTGLAELLKDDV